MPSKEKRKAKPAFFKEYGKQITYALVSIKFFYERSPGMHAL